MYSEAKKKKTIPCGRQVCLLKQKEKQISYTMPCVRQVCNLKPTQYIISTMPCGRQVCNRNSESNKTNEFDFVLRAASMFSETNRKANKFDYALRAASM